MKNSSILVGLIAGIAVAFSAYADEYADTALALCEKVKSCAVAEMGQQKLTPEMRQMMKPLLDSMCDQVLLQIPEVANGHELYAPALACMKSMEAVDCSDMQQTEYETPACQEFDKLSEQ